MNKYESAMEVGRHKYSLISTANCKWNGRIEYSYAVLICTESISICLFIKAAPSSFLKAFETQNPHLYEVTVLPGCVKAHVDIG